MARVTRARKAAEERRQPASAQRPGAAAKEARAAAEAEAARAREARAVAEAEALGLPLDEGELEVSLVSEWTNEVESDGMPLEAAKFWQDKEEYLQIGGQFEDILEEWDEEENGPQPEGAQIDFELSGDTEHVHQGVLLVVSLQNLKLTEQQRMVLAPVLQQGDEGEGCKIELPLSAIVGAGGPCEDMLTVSANPVEELSGIIKGPSWVQTTGWKGQEGAWHATVEESTTLGAFFRDNLECSARACQANADNSDIFVTGLYLCEEDAEFEGGRSKSGDIEIRLE